MSDPTGIPPGAHDRWLDQGQEEAWGTTDEEEQDAEDQDEEDPEDADCLDDEEGR